MSEPAIKSRLESTELTTNAAAVQTRLDACLQSDASNIRPGSTGEHVAVIQRALNSIRQRRPAMNLPEITDAAGSYGPDTTRAVRAFKAFHVIVRKGQPLDAIVGRMTITRLDDELLEKPPAPPPPPADITVIAAEIKASLQNADDADLEFLARLFEEDRIVDTGTGNELVNRLNTILAASSDGSNNGVTHFAGIYAGLKDKGFREAFKDPWPGFSDNQVGHFTTGVDMGFRPQQTFALLPKSLQEFIRRTSDEAPFSIEERTCVRLIVGHEQVADNASQAFVQQALSPLAGEVGKFFAALDSVTTQPRQNITRSRTALLGIRVGTGQGNSFQDLHLSLFGYKLGKLIKLGGMSTRADAALWIRSNLGSFIPNPLPPGPPTG